MGGAVRRKIPLYWSTGSGWLQVIKGWLENGEEQHKVWDVVCADGRTADASGRCSATAADLDLETCAQRNDVGAAELTARFVDPDFAADQRAFYYIRVLENPSCRWTNWLANSAGVALPNDVPAIRAAAGPTGLPTAPVWRSPTMCPQRCRTVRGPRRSGSSLRPHLGSSRHCVDDDAQLPKWTCQN